jgi:electron transfer flavoprotein beta subunit
LSIPHSTIIMEVNVDPSTGPGHVAGVRVKRELEGGWFQYVTMPLPALLTIQSGINQLRYATLKGIMAAKKKAIAKVAPPAAAAARQKITALYAPQKSKQTVMITGSPAEAAKELVKRLREEARAL